MSRRLIVRPDADHDIEEAFNWYENQHEGLGVRFLAAVDVGLRAIETNPALYRPVYKRARRVLLSKFPYALFYVGDDDADIELIACMHHRRHPLHWRTRAS
jgi:plasmid stabilization system protein ParE